MSKKITIVACIIFLCSVSNIFAQSFIKVTQSNVSAAKGQALYDKGRYEEATAPLESAIKIRPEHGRAHYYLALTYEKLGDKEKAIRLLEYYLDYAMHPKEGLTSMDVEYLSKCMGLLGEMIPYNEIYKLENTQTKTCLYNMHGSRYYHNNKYDVAIDSFKKAMEARPQDAMAHFSLAICYHELNRNGEAIDLLESYLKYIESAKPDLSYTDSNEYIPQIRSLLNDLKKGKL